MLWTLVVYRYLGEGGMNLCKWNLRRDAQCPESKSGPGIPWAAKGWRVWETWGRTTYVHPVPQASAFDHWWQQNTRLTGSFVQSCMVCLCSSVTLYQYQVKAISSCRPCYVWRFKANLYREQYKSQSLCEAPLAKIYIQSSSRRNLCLANKANKPWYLILCPGELSNRPMLN